MPKQQSSSRKKLPPFDKYYHYGESVQSPAEDARFLEQIYRDARGRTPSVLREDFCGGFANCCDWVKRSPTHVAHGVDLDPEPIAYGTEHYLSKLTPSQQSRVHVHRKNVLGRGLPNADVICALNFSYFIFKERTVLKNYFKTCLRTLNKGGIMVMDCFGGPRCQEANEEVSENGDPGFDYFWDQDSFDPLTHEAKFFIHFKRPGEKKQLEVFSYDWRMWSLPELKDLLMEVGFTKVDFLWEGSTDDGEGDGDFKVSTRGEECEAWVAYVSAHK